MDISSLKTDDKGHELAFLQICTELFFSTEANFMDGKCSFKEKQWEVSSEMQEKKLKQEELSTSVANGPTLSPLI